MRAGPCARRPGWGQKQVMRPCKARQREGKQGGRTNLECQAVTEALATQILTGLKSHGVPTRMLSLALLPPTLFMPPKMGSSLPFQAEASDLGPAWLLSESRSLPRAMICLPVASFSQPQLCPQRPHGPLLPQPQNCSSEIWTQWPRPHGWSWRQMPQEES